jgi:hypothetical protein
VWRIPTEAIVIDVGIIPTRRDEQGERNFVNVHAPAAPAEVAIALNPRRDHMPVLVCADDITWCDRGCSVTLAVDRRRLRQTVPHFPGWRIAGSVEEGFEAVRHTADLKRVVERVLVIELEREYIRNCWCT